MSACWSIISFALETADPLAVNMFFLKTTVDNVELRPEGLSTPYGVQYSRLIDIHYLPPKGVSL